MTQAEHLARRVYRWQIGFSLGAAVTLGFTVPLLLQLSSTLTNQVNTWVVALICGGSLLTTLITWFSLKRYRFLLRAVSVDRREGSTATVDAAAVARFAHEPAHLTRIWLLGHCLALGLLLAPFRPERLDWTTAVTVVLLGILMLATASLPLHVLVRHAFLEVIELAPSALMREVITRYERAPATRSRINRRIVIAVATPVLFVALGSALIVNAHLRRDDETSRAETARLLARAALEVRPGGIEGLKRALERAARLGFPAQITSPQERYGMILERSGIAELSTPLDSGSASVRFNASTVEVLSAAPVIVSLLATIAAAIVGFLLGNLLSTDLYYATRGVRLLGATPSVRHQHTGVLRRPRLKLIADLGAAIDALTGRFAVFAQAQENAIDARATAVRARGLFFASVSHDLKAPLNSILGFTHVVGLQPLSQGQRESLDAIQSRAQELLALIETILDAARVEEGHLSLATDEVPLKELFDLALRKARQLSSSYEPQIFEEIEDGIPPLLIDRTRLVRALATLVAYSIRTNGGGKMWVRAERETADTMRIDVDVPRPAHSPTDLELMLSPTPEQPGREHRGLSLGLRLARSVVQLHRGTVRVVDRGKKGAMFCVKLPTVSVPMPAVSAPLHSIPAPPSSRPPPSYQPASAPPPSSGVPPPSYPAMSYPPPSSYPVSQQAPASSPPSSLSTNPLPTGLGSVWPDAPLTGGAPLSRPAERYVGKGAAPAVGTRGPLTEGDTWQSIPRPPKLPDSSTWSALPQPSELASAPHATPPSAPGSQAAPPQDAPVAQTPSTDDPNPPGTT
jgi:signal transduction histidine kinase